MQENAHIEPDETKDNVGRNVWQELFLKAFVKNAQKPEKCMWPDSISAIADAELWRES